MATESGRRITSSGARISVPHRKVTQQGKLRTAKVAKLRSATRASHWASSGHVSKHNVPAYSRACPRLHSLWLQPEIFQTGRPQAGLGLHNTTPRTAVNCGTTPPWPWCRPCRVPRNRVLRHEAVVCLQLRCSRRQPLATCAARVCARVGVTVCATTLGARHGWEHGVPFLEVFTLRAFSATPSFA